MKEQTPPIPALLQAVDDLIIARATGQNDAQPIKALIEARRNVGEITTTRDQFVALLDARLNECLLPVYTEKKVCELLGLSRGWLWEERKAGRWTNFTALSGGKRVYSREQLDANIRGEVLNQKSNLKLA